VDMTRVDGAMHCDRMFDNVVACLEPHPFFSQDARFFRAIAPRSVDCDMCLSRIPFP